MSLGYIILILIQPVVLVMPSVITFKMRKKIYAVYMYIIYTAFVLSTEIIGIYANNNKLKILFLLYCILEMMYPYFFAKFFLNNMLWKSVVFYFIIGAIINVLLSVGVMAIPLAQKNFNAYINYERTNVDISGALVIAIIFLVLSIVVSFIFRKLLTKDKESKEGFYRILFIVYSTINTISVVYFKTDFVQMTQQVLLYYRIVMPLLIFSEFLLIIFVITYQEKWLIDNKYRSLKMKRKEERGDSNKEIVIFDDGLGGIINSYLNKKVNEYRHLGIAVDVISYMSDFISCPIDDRDFIFELDQIFEKYNDIIRMRVSNHNELARITNDRKLYLILGFKMNKEGLIIHIEYNRYDRFNIISRLLEREYLTLTSEYYRLEQIGIYSNEILMIFPYK